MAVVFDPSGFLASLGGSLAAGLKEQTKAQKLMELAQQTPGMAPDPQRLGAVLLSLGDVPGAMTAAQLAQAQSDRQWQRQTSERDFGFREQEAQRAQGNVDRNFALQQRLAATKEAPKTIDVDDGRGGKTTMMWDGSRFSPVETPTSGAAPTNPYASGKFNKDQGLAATYADRTSTAHQIISELEGINQGAAAAASNAAQAVLPEGAFNVVAGPDRQRFIQAQRDFVNAQLRRESGAAISQSEFDNARKQYFPQPGDSPQVIEQKRINRATTIQGLMREAGPSYAPSIVFDEKGGATKAGKAASGQQPSGPADRYKALRASGLSKEAAYAQMAKEGL